MLKKVLLSTAIVVLGLIAKVSPLTAQWEPIQYKMEIRVDYRAEKIFADCELVVKNNSTEPAFELPLILYRLLTVTSVRDSLGNKIPFEQNVKTVDGSPRLQVNAVTVNLPRKIIRDEKYRIHISYEGYIFGYTEGVGPYVKERIEEPFTILRQDTHSYPTPAKPTRESMRNVVFHSYSYSASITVPEHLMVANGGTLVTKSNHNGETTFTYNNIKPAWRMDFAIAPYETMERDGFKIFFFPENKEGAERVLTVSKKCFELYTEWFGALKDFQNFSIIQIPEGYGSQADVTSILQTAEVFADATLNRLIYHEISHLWHPKETEPFPGCRWNEGLATFLEYLTAQELDNRENLLNRASEFFTTRFAEVCPENPNCKEIPLIDYGKLGLTGFSYSKGMVLFHVLYELAGHDSFMNLVGEYYRKYFKTGGSTHALAAMIAELPHKGLSRFVDEWFYGTESNDYLFQGKSVEEIVSIYNTSGK
ncbi:MAG: M1 family aminopeptidase [Candidatus Aminicenantes bacterium]